MLNKFFKKKEKREKQEVLDTKNYGSTGAKNIIFTSENGDATCLGIGDRLYPDCGFKPNDFVIEDIVFSHGQRYVSFYGYHPASKDKKRYKRGYFDITKVSLFDRDGEIYFW